MVKLFKSIVSLSMILITVAVPTSVGANESRVIPGPIDGWPKATVTKTSWSTSVAKGQSVVFDVKAGATSASTTVLNIELTNAKITDKYGQVVCSKIGTKGSCPTIYTIGISNRYSVKAGTNGGYASYKVESAFYY